MTKDKEIKNRKLEGVVTSDKMHKTIVVAVVRTSLHPKYQKQYKITKKYKAHDEENLYKTGDMVVIEASRPISKDKRWVVIGKA